MSEVDDQIDAADKLLDKTLAFSKEMFQLGQGYNQVLIAAGYAAHLTLWAKMAPFLPRTTVLISGGLLGLALFVFVSYYLATICVRTFPAIKLGKKLQSCAGDTQAMLEAYVDYDVRHARASGFLMVIWLPIFVVSTVAGLSSAALLVGHAFWSVVYTAHP